MAEAGCFFILGFEFGTITTQSVMCNLKKVFSNTLQVMTGDSLLESFDAERKNETADKIMYKKGKEHATECI